MNKKKPKSPPAPRAVRAWAIAREGRIILALVNTDRWKRNDLVDNEEVIRVLVTPVLPRRAPTPKEIEREKHRLAQIILQKGLRGIALDRLRRRGK